MNPQLPQASPIAATSAGKRCEASGFALFDYGFRPFFLLAAIHAVLAIPIWALLATARLELPLALPPLVWHAHEMLYGFVAAAIAGFLLTAVPSWTGRRGYAGKPLILLVLLWCAGRVLLAVPTPLPATIVAAIDLAFLPALALTLLPALLRSGNRRNLMFVAALTALFGANIWFHSFPEQAIDALHFGFGVVLLMLVVLGKRMIPAFTSARLKELGHDIAIRRRPLLDRFALLLAVTYLAVEAVAPAGRVAALTALGLALAVGLLLARWHGHRTLGEPLLWVLHIAYAWIVVALVLKAALLFGANLPASAWLHALTTGAMATMILGVMSRAALGHTGRPLRAPPAIVLAYAALSGAAAIRVCGPIFHGDAWNLWIASSASLWTLAFGLFLGCYAPILWQPRIDGRPG